MEANDLLGDEEWMMAGGKPSNIRKTKEPHQIRFEYPPPVKTKRASGFVMDPKHDELIRELAFKYRLTRSSALAHIIDTYMRYRGRK